MKKLFILFVSLSALAQEPIANLPTSGATPGQVALAGINGAIWTNPPAYNGNGGNTWVQFNNHGMLYGQNNFTYDAVSQLLTIGNIEVPGNITCEGVISGDGTGINVLSEVGTWPPMQESFNITNQFVTPGPNRTRLGAGFTMWSNNPTAHVVVTNGTLLVSKDTTTATLTFKNLTIANTIYVTNSAAHTIEFRTTDANEILGIVNEDGFVGGGFGLINLDASQLLNGTVPGTRYGAPATGVSGPMVTTNGAGASVLSFNAGSLTNYGGVKVYRALLTQAGTAAPSATVLENSIGAIVWARSVAGVYTATLSSAFTTSKTFARASITPWGGVGTVNTSYIVHTSTSVLTLTTVLTDVSGPASDPLDDLMTGTPVEILVYP